MVGRCHGEAGQAANKQAAQQTECDFFHVLIVIPNRVKVQFHGVEKRGNSVWDIRLLCAFNSAIDIYIPGIACESWQLGEAVPGRFIHAALHRLGDTHDQ